MCVSECVCVRSHVSLVVFCYATIGNMNSRWETKQPSKTETTKRPNPMLTSCATHRQPGPSLNDARIASLWRRWGFGLCWQPKLQARVYDIFPSTNAVFTDIRQSFAYQAEFYSFTRHTIGSWKLSANEQFFCWCSNRSNFVTNNSDYIRRLFYNWPCCLCQLK